MAHCWSLDALLDESIRLDGGQDGLKAFADVEHCCKQVYERAEDSWGDPDFSEKRTQNRQTRLKRRRKFRQVSQDESCIHLRKGYEPGQLRRKHRKRREKGPFFELI